MVFFCFCKYYIISKWHRCLIFYSYLLSPAYYQLYPRLYAARRDRPHSLPQHQCNVTSPLLRGHTQWSRVRLWPGSGCFVFFLLHAADIRFFSLYSCKWLTADGCGSCPVHIQITDRLAHLQISDLYMCRVAAQPSAVFSTDSYID